MNFIACILFACNLPYASEDEQLSAYRTKEFIAAWNLSGPHVKAWQIEYQAAGDDDLFYEHRTFACDEEGLCFYGLAKGGKGSDFNISCTATSWREDAFQQWNLLRNDTVYSGLPFNRNLTLSTSPSGGPFPERLHHEISPVFLGWWVYTDREFPRLKGNIPVVRQDIIACGKHALKPERMLYEGRWCEVIEHPGHDAIWVDAERGFIWMKREIFDPSTGKLSQRLLMHNPKEVAPGIWVPYEITIESFRDEADFDRDSDQSMTTSHIRVIKFTINDLVDRMVFAVPENAPGTIRVNPDHTYEQIVPNGHDLMDDMASFVQKAGYFKRATRESNLLLRWRSTFLSAGAFSAVMSCWFILRRVSMIHLNRLALRFWPSREIQLPEVHAH